MKSAQHLTKDQLIEKESRDINDRLAKLTTERREIVHDAHDLSSTLDDFDSEFNSVSLEDFPSAEQMEIMLDEFEDNKERSIAALTEVNRALEKIGHTSDLNDPDEPDVDTNFRSSKLSEDHSKKIAAVTAKLAVLFGKSKKYYTDVIQSFSEEMDADIKPDTDVNVEVAVIPMLQQKVVHLKKDLELAQMKSRSLNVQWAADREKFEEILAVNKQEMQIMSQRLIVAETKKRYKEQVDRDDNMVSESVSRVEYNYALEEIEELKAKVSVSELELAEKRTMVDQLTRESAQKDVDNANLERKVASLEQRLELASQAKEHFQKKHEESLVELEKKLSALRDTIEKIRSEQRSTLEENKSLLQEQQYLNQQVEALKRENDENFKFLHKAEEDSKNMRAFAAETQAASAAQTARINDLLNEKEELNNKISGSMTERQSLVSDVDASRSQLRKMTAAVKSFAKTFKSMPFEETIEKKLLAQATRLQELEELLLSSRKKFVNKTNSMEAQLKAYRKKVMMLEYAQTQGGAPEDYEEQASSAIKTEPQQLISDDADDEAELSISNNVTGDMISRQEYDKLVASEKKKSDALKSKEESLASNRKAMELQSNAMESQAKALEKQKQALDEKLKQYQSLEDDVTKLREELQAAVAKLHDIDISNLTAAEKREAIAAALDGRVRNALIGVIHKTMADIGIVEDAPVVLSRPKTQDTYRGSSRRVSISEETDGAQGSSSVRPMSTRNSGRNAEYTEVTCDEVSAELAAHAQHVWDILKPLVSSNEERSEEELFLGIQQVIESTVTDFGPALAELKSKPVSATVTRPASSMNEVKEDARMHPQSKEELETVQSELFRSGTEFEHVDEPTTDDFERLMTMCLADDQLVKLTQLEYNAVYNSKELVQQIDPTTGEILEDLSVRNFRRGSKTMQVLESQIDIELERILLTKQIAKKIDLAKLSEYLTLTEKRILAMNTFTAWRSLMAYKEGGVFLDVLIVHRDVLSSCIEHAGGWVAAMELVKRRKDLTSDTAIWPDFLRIQVLEFYRTAAGEEMTALKSEIESLNAKLEEAAEREIAAAENDNHHHHHHSHSHSHAHRRGSRDHRGSFGDASGLNDPTRRRSREDLPSPNQRLDPDDHQSSYNDDKLHRHGSELKGDDRRSSTMGSAQNLNWNSTTPISSEHDRSGSDINRSRPPSHGTRRESRVYDGRNDEKSGDDLLKKAPSRRNSRLVDDVKSPGRIGSQASSRRGSRSGLLEAENENENDAVNNVDDVEEGSDDYDSESQSSSGDSEEEETFEEEGQLTKGKSITSEPSRKKLNSARKSKRSSAAKTEKSKSRKSKRSNSVRIAPGSRPSSRPTTSELEDGNEGIEEEEEEDSAQPDEATPDSSYRRRGSSQMHAAVNNIRNLAKQKREQAENVNVKLMAKENLRKHLAHRRSSRDADANSEGTMSRPKTAGSEPGGQTTLEDGDEAKDEFEVKDAHLKQFDGKLNIALKAANSHMDGMAAKKIGSASPSVAALLETSPPERHTKSLHKHADELIVRLLAGEEDAKVIAEVVLEAIDCWRDHHLHQAADMLELSLPFCTLPEETAFVLALKSRLLSVEDLTGEALEVGEKILSILQYLDKLHATEELHRQQWLQVQHQQTLHIQDIHKQQMTQLQTNANAALLSATGTAVPLAVHTNTHGSPSHPHPHPQMHSPTHPAVHGGQQHFVDSHALTHNPTVAVNNVYVPTSQLTGGHTPIPPQPHPHGQPHGRHSLNASGQNSRRPSQMDRSVSPGFHDGTVSLSMALKRNRVARQEDRENTRKIASQLREEVAEVVASALAAATCERVDMGIQTEESGEAIQQLVSSQSMSLVTDSRDEEDEDAFDDDDDIGDEFASAFSSKMTIVSPNKESIVHTAPLTTNYSAIFAALPPGFKLVHATDRELELCPGVTFASYSRLTPQQYSDLPRGVIYCYRDSDAALMNGLKRVPRYVTSVPRIEGCEAIIIPTVFELTEEIQMISSISMETLIELPRDVFVVHMIRNAVLPSGLTVIELSPLLEVPPAISIPAGLELVQMHLALMLPPGVHVSPDCEIIAPPKDMPPLPHNVQLIRRQPGTQLPSYMTLIHTSTVEHHTELVLHSKMEEGCTVLKKPLGVEFGLGVEILSRPFGHPMPVGFSPLPFWEYPKGIQLQPQQELVRMVPKFELSREWVPAPNWRIYPRPAPVKLPPNCYLINYEGDRGGGVIPPCMRKIALPDVPYGVVLPKTVIAVEFLRSFGYPIPYDSKLGTGITILRPENAIVLSRAKANKKMGKAHDVDDIMRLLPVNAVLVSRESGAPLPDDVERASKGNLPSGVLLAPHVEILLIPVRFELPAGVKIESGALLGRRTQICPGTVLSRDLEVLEWPRGLSLSPGTELVKLNHGCDMPIGYHPTQFPRTELFAMGLEKNSFVVRLPHFIKMESAQQLSEKITVVTEFTTNSTLSSPAKDSYTGSPTFGRQFSVEMAESIPVGSVLVLRNSKRFQLPSEMTSLPKSILSNEVKNALVRHNVASKTMGTGGNTPGTVGSSTEHPSSHQYVHQPHLDAVQLAPSYAFPPGTELAPGVIVQPRPYWMQETPYWVELVSIADPGTNAISEKEVLDEAAKKKKMFARHLARKLKFMRVNIRPELNPFTNLPFDLPPKTEFILIPEDIQVYRWGSSHGIEAAIRPDSMYLPIGHFLVERPRVNTVPPGMRLGFASEYAKYARQITLPPCIEVIHLEPAYHLPRGVGMQSSLPLVPLSAGANLTSSWASWSQKSFSEASGISAIQLCHLQPISHGVHIVANPFGWNGRPLLTDKEPSTDSSSSSHFLTSFHNTSSGDSNESSFDDVAYAFVALDVPNFYMLPEMKIVENSDEIVAKYFCEYPGFSSDHTIAEVSETTRTSGGHTPKDIIVHSSREETKDSAADADISAGNTNSKSYRITDIVKLVMLPHKLPNPRERHRKRSLQNSILMARTAAKTDVITVHPRVMVYPDCVAEDNDAPISQPHASTESSVAVTQNEEGTKNASAEPDSLELSQIESSEAPHHDAWSAKISLNLTGRGRPPSQPYQIQMTGRKSARSDGSFESATRRPRILMRMGAALGIDGRPIPDIETVLTCLDGAQEEIDMLEVENNKYRFKTVTAQREIDHLKNRLERMAEQQKSKAEEFQALRDKVSELKGTVANVNKTIELKSYDFKEAKRRLQEEILSYQTRVDVLNSQLSHWQDVAEGVDQMKSNHNREMLKLRTNCRERIKKTLDRTVRGCRIFVDLLGETLVKLSMGVLTETYQQKLLAAKGNRSFQQLALQFLGKSNSANNINNASAHNLRGLNQDDSENHSIMGSAAGSLLPRKPNSAPVSIPKEAVNSSALNLHTSVGEDDEISVLSAEDHIHSRRPSQLAVMTDSPEKEEEKKLSSKDLGQKAPSPILNITVPDQGLIMKDSLTETPRILATFSPRRSSSPVHAGGINSGSPSSPKRAGAQSPGRLLHPVTSQHYGTVYLSNGPKIEEEDFAAESGKIIQNIVDMFDSLLTTRDETSNSSPNSRIQFSSRVSRDIDDHSETSLHSSAEHSEASIISSYIASSGGGSVSNSGAGGHGGQSKQRKSIVPAVSLEAAMDEDEEHDTKHSLELLNSVKLLAEEAKPHLDDWYHDVLTHVRLIGQDERAMYYHALQRADLEKHVFLRQQRIAARKAEEQECVISDARQAANGVPVPTAELRQQIAFLQLELSRLQEQSVQSGIEAIRNQVILIEDLKAMEKSLLIQADTIDARAAEKDLIDNEKGGEYITPTEIRAIKAEVMVLRRDAEQYRERATALAKDRQEGMLSIIRDIEAYEQAVQGVVPPQLLSQLLQWGASRYEETRKKEQVAQEIKALSPMKSKTSVLSQKSKAPTATTGISASSPTVFNDMSAESVSMPVPDPNVQLKPLKPAAMHAQNAVQLLAAAKISKMPQSSLVFGSTGTMPVAPAKSMFNLANIAPLDDSGSVGGGSSVYSKKSTSSLRSVKQPKRQVQAVAGGVRLKKLDRATMNISPSNLNLYNGGGGGALIASSSSTTFGGSMDSISRGGVMAVSSSTSNLPSINIGLTLTSLSRNAQQQQQQQRNKNISSA